MLEIYPLPQVTVTQFAPLWRNGKHGSGSVGALLKELVAHNHPHSYIGNPRTRRQFPPETSCSRAKILNDKMPGLSTIDRVLDIERAETFLCRSLPLDRHNPSP